MYLYVFKLRIYINIIETIYLKTVIYYTDTNL